MDTLFFSPAYMEEVFAGLNLVLAGWLLLFLAPFFPQFKYTFLLVDGIVILYCGVYLFLLVPIVIAIIERGESVNFGSLENVHRLFQSRDVMLAGWTHYVAFDLFVGSRVVLDAQRLGFPHLLVCFILPIFLMAGPVGMVMYAVIRVMFLISRRMQLRIKLTVLSILYALVVSLCVMMTFWIFVFPATAFMTRNKTWLWVDCIDERSGEKSISSAVPLSLTTKYVGHTIVQLLHQLPCGLWVLLLPFQLLTCIRRKYSTVHRTLGYIFTMSSVLLIVGVFFIDRNDLGYVQNDYPTLVPKLLSKEGMAIADEFGLFGHITRLLFPFDRLIMLFISIWFTVTILMAVVMAREGKFKNHRAWIYRHTASGLWVAVMRILVVIGAFADKSKEMGQFINFTCGIIFSCILTATLAEVAIYYEETKTKAKQSSRLQKEKVFCCACVDMEI